MKSWLVDRIAEDHHVAAQGFAHRDHLRFHDRQPQPVGELVDQDEIADLERGPHRRRRNLEGFCDERSQQEHDEQDREEAGRILDPRRLRRIGGAAPGEIEAIGEPQHTGGKRQQEQDQREIHCCCRLRQPADCAMRCAGAGRHPARAFRASSTFRLPAGWPGTPPAEFPHCPRTSCAFCRPSAFPAASSCGRCRRRNTLQARSCAWP